ncbi:MAG: ribose-phosphate diphosphokinase, partial [Elusimicrobiota bacterium]
MKIIGGSASKVLTEDICNFISRGIGYINLLPSDVLLTTFSDGEPRIEIKENMRNEDVFIIQSLSYPINDHLMELMFILDALKRSDVHSITVVMPYYGCGRQDKKDKPRVPISSKVVADMLEMSGIKRLVTLDLHAPQIQGFFSIPVDNLYGSSVFLPHMKKFKNGLSIISPDAGGNERATHYAKKLDCEMSFCYKHRSNPNEIGEMKLIGSVEGRDCVIVDDICDTAGTLTKSANKLKEAGALSVNAFITHGVLSGDGVEKVNDSCIDSIYITDSIQQPEKVLKNNKFHIVSIDELIG